MIYRPKLLFCDVDRTLLTHGHVMVPEVVAAIRKTDDAGIQVVLASARSVTGARHIHEALGLRGPVICFNGAWCGTTDDTQPWHSFPLDRAMAAAVVAAALEADLVPMWYAADSVYALNANAEAAEYQARVTRDRLQIVGSWSEIPTDPYKIMLVSPPNAVEAARSRVSLSCGDAVSVVRSGPGLIEVVQKGISKATATALVAKRLGLTAMDCAAVGDGDNDVEMLRWADLPLSVANGVAEARQLAKYVGGHCDEGGVTRVIDWLVSLPARPSASETQLLPATATAPGRFEN